MTHLMHIKEHGRYFDKCLNGGGGGGFINKITELNKQIFGKFNNYSLIIKLKY